LGISTYRPGSKSPDFENASVTADPATNSLVISASPGLMDLFAGYLGPPPAFLILGNFALKSPNRDASPFPLVKLV
jgi:hypothetical protein